MATTSEHYAVYSSSKNFGYYAKVNYSISAGTVTVTSIEMKQDSSSHSYSAYYTTSQTATLKIGTSSHSIKASNIAKNTTTYYTSVSGSWSGSNGSESSLTITWIYRGRSSSPYTLTHSWTISLPRHTVSYNANGGTSTPGSQTGYDGQSITLSSAISKSNSNSNVTITVGYNANGGSGAPGNSTGTAINTTPYSFANWRLNSTSGTAYAAKASYTIPTSNVTMYATWTTGTTTRKSNPSITLSSTKPTRPGCTFLGWSTNSSATSATYSAGTAYTFSANTTLYAVWSANTPPSISYTTGEAGTNSVDITTTNSGTISYVKNYPLNLSDLPMKVLNDGSVWARIYYHNSKAGTVLWSSTSEALNIQDTNKYSRLNLLTDSLKGSDGKFEFMLCYPVNSSSYNRWKQNNAPQNEYVATTSAGDGVASGYEAISIAWTASYWGGMTRQNSDTSSISSCYLSGSVGHGNWYYALAPSSSYQNGVPSYGENTARQVELWVRVPNVSGAIISCSSGINTLQNLDAASTYAICAGTSNSNGVGYSSTTKIVTAVDVATIRIKINNEWKEAVPYVKTNGEWKAANFVYVKQNGEWKESE